MRPSHPLCAALIFLVTGSVLPVSAQFVSVEPDHYASGTILNQIIPEVRLITAGVDNRPMLFNITATEDPDHFVSTGTRVFGHENIRFMSDIRRLRMDFSGLVSSLSIDFISSAFSLLEERGHLEAYALDNTLVASFVTENPDTGVVVPMSIQRPLADIAWAVAWSEGLTFGRLDNLVFSTPVPVPEPSGRLLLGAGLCALGVGLRVRRATK